MQHETGTWSSSQGRFIPIDQSRNEHPDFAIGRFDETGEIRAVDPERGRVVDDVDWTERALSGRASGARPDSRGPDSRGPNSAGPGSGGWPTGAHQTGAYQTGAYQTGHPPEPAPWPPAQGRELALRRPDPSSYRPGPPLRDPFGRDAGVPEPEPSTVDDEDEGEEVPRIGVVVALVSTLTWYVLAATLYVLGLFVTNEGTLPAGCSGAACVSPRTQALTDSVQLLPWVGIATVQAVVFALVLRWLGPGWKAGGLGFSAATVAAATTTAMFTLLGGGGF